MHDEFKHLSNYKSVFGLIGYPLSHSFSKGYFAQKFEKENISGFFYESFPLEAIKVFPELWEILPNLKGLNVTIPYKEQVIPFLDEVQEAAAEIKAVNTIKKMPDGKLVGFNTDVVGFEQSLSRKAQGAGINLKKALVLGTGGAAKAVFYVLKKLNIDYKVVSRSRGKGDLLYGEISKKMILEVDLIINTTPLGMAPAIDTFPELPYEGLSEKHLLYDLVYNPEKTVFLRKGESQGAAIINGLEMLHIQAEAAWQIWNRF